jgi:DDE superfamily endonuclease/Helix-turn-helix of DDE superfamily endonuclease
VYLYSVKLDVHRNTARYVAALLRAERRRLGTRRGTRVLSPFQQALFVLAWLRDKPDIERLGVGFGLARSTAYRYLEEGIKVLAARAPTLAQALERAKAEQVPYLILDGKTVLTDRTHAQKKTSRKGRRIDAWYSGKTHDFGGLIQALMNPRGIPLWVSEVMPGSEHDITAARTLLLATMSPYLREMPCLADGGYEGAGCGVKTAVKKRKGVELGDDTETYNMLLRAVRCLGERGFALLTQRWKTLQSVTCCPRKITVIARACLVLVHFEHKMITE